MKFFLTLIPFAFANHLDRHDNEKITFTATKTTISIDWSALNVNLGPGEEFVARLGNSLYESGAMLTGVPNDRNDTGGTTDEANRQQREYWEGSGTSTTFTGLPREGILFKAHVFVYNRNTKRYRKVASRHVRNEGQNAYNTRKFRSNAMGILTWPMVHPECYYAMEVEFPCRLEGRVNWNLHHEDPYHLPQGTAIWNKGKKTWYIVMTEETIPEQEHYKYSKYEIFWNVDTVCPSGAFSKYSAKVRTRSDLVSYVNNPPVQIQDRMAFKDMDDDEGTVTATYRFYTDHMVTNLVCDVDVTMTISCGVELVRIEGMTNQGDSTTGSSFALKALDRWKQVYVFEMQFSKASCGDNPTVTMNVGYNRIYQERA